MKNASTLRIAVIICVSILLILSTNNGIAIVKILLNPPQERISEGQDIRIKAFELVDKALVTRSKPVNYSFEGGFDSPMRKLSQTPQERETGKTGNQQVVRKELFLKGILIKDDALAILEDAEGKTYICKQGERVHDRVIAEIGEDLVTLQDTDGSRSTLKVKEK